MANSAGGFGEIFETSRQALEWSRFGCLGLCLSWRLGLNLS